MTTDVLPEPDEEIGEVTEEAPEADLVRVPIAIPPYTATERSPIKPIGPNSRTFRPAEDFREWRKKSTKPRQMWFEDIVARLYAAMGCSSVPFWLASGARQEVRSEASWALCILIRFSA